MPLLQVSRFRRAYPGLAEWSSWRERFHIQVQRRRCAGLGSLSPHQSVLQRKIKEHLNMQLSLIVGLKAPLSLCLCYMFRRLKINLVLYCLVLSLTDHVKSVLHVLVCWFSNTWYALQRWHNGIQCIAIKQKRVIIRIKRFLSYVIRQPLVLQYIRFLIYTYFPVYFRMARCDATLLTLQTISNGCKKVCQYQGLKQFEPNPALKIKTGYIVKYKENKWSTE